MTDTDANLPENKSDHPPSIPVHTIQINAVPGSPFPHSGLGVVIPPEVAAQIATGGFNLMMEPVTPAVEGEPSRFTIKAVPIVPANPVNFNDNSASGNQTGCSQTETESIVVNSTPALQTPSLPSQQSKKARTSPSSRKPAPIFKFAQPPKIPCSKEGCPSPDRLTSSRCQSCSVPVHGNCLHNRVLCTVCYNARMVQHKATQKKKRSASTAGSKLTGPSSKKLKMSAGLSKGKTQNPPKTKSQGSTLLSATMVSDGSKAQGTLMNGQSKEWSKIH